MSFNIKSALSGLEEKFEDGFFETEADYELAKLDLLDHFYDHIRDLSENEDPDEGCDGRYGRGVC